MGRLRDVHHTYPPYSVQKQNVCQMSNVVFVNWLNICGTGVLITIR